MSRLPLPFPAVSPGMRIGIFGGSFNPAHAGHLAIANEALKRLRLDELWWLVSPQNPLKDPSETDDFERRVALSRKLVHHPRIKIMTFERQLGTTNTAATLRALRPLLARARFAWVMGADSFATLHRWHNWLRIPQALPLAVFDRPGYTLQALHSPAAQRLAPFRLDASDSAALPGHPTPAWCFIPIPRRSDSSTALRRRPAAK
ncbi:nicotinate-nucleotide adenylyltransferase [Rhodoligotrophos defluvii]|uniref:nicotinate-nucleotide adenylyltransferase n=1 Tax=Rhodoligotrophos defluvii TaxID=2561934 RepID=UPI0010CA1929|nr:nicotinate-nucleotide adenylyltransferase [Rhodoligotrophos defluvii]